VNTGNLGAEEVAVILVGGMLGAAGGRGCGGVLGTPPHLAFVI